METKCFPSQETFLCSFKNVLKTKAKKQNVQTGDIYNPYERMFKKGFNTLGYRDNINLFDQILFTSPLVDKGEKDFSSFKMFKSAIFNKSFLTSSKVLKASQTKKYSHGHIELIHKGMFHKHFYLGYCLI